MILQHDLAALWLILQYLHWGSSQILQIPSLFQVSHETASNVLFVPIQVLRTTPAEFVKGSLQQESHQDHDLIQDEILDRDVKRAGKSAPCSDLNSLDNSSWICTKSCCKIWFWIMLWCKTKLLIKVLEMQVINYDERLLATTMCFSFWSNFPGQFLLYWHEDLLQDPNQDLDLNQAPDFGTWS